jgi:hypothetical protein
VYNSAAHPIKGITMAGWTDTTLRLVDKIPLTGMMWKEAIFYTKYKTWYYVNLIFLHLIPALLIDGVIRLRGKKPLYVNIHCMWEGCVSRRAQQNKYGKLRLNSMHNLQGKSIAKRVRNLNYITTCFGLWRPSSGQEFEYSKVEGGFGWLATQTLLLL